MRSLVVLAVLCLVLTFASANRRTTTQKPPGRQGGGSGGKLLAKGRGGGGGKLKGQDKDFEFARSQDVRLVEGSGALTHTDDDGGDDDDDDAEQFSGERALGSGAPLSPPAAPLTPCLKMLHDASTQGMLGAFMPRCTAGGDFHPTQCHGSTGECWCADRLGAKIAGTVMNAPNTPNCSRTGGGGGATPVPPPVAPRTPARTPPRTPSGGAAPPQTRCQQRLREATELEEMDVYYPQCTPGGEFEPRQCYYFTGTCWCVDHLGAKVPGTETSGQDRVDCRGGGQHPLGPGPSVPSPYQPGGRGGTGGPPPEEPKRDKLSKAIVGQPGILAGLIGGTVIALLCLILLIMFIVYRVRKNREQVDEKSNKVPFIGYTNGHDRDLYA